MAKMRTRSYRIQCIDGTDLEAEGIVRDGLRLELETEFSFAFEGNLAKFDRIKTQGPFGESLIFPAGCHHWTT